MSIILIKWLFILISVILIIPFLTLLERKILGYIQIRKGPNKVRILGILQPVSDGLKLIIKESRFPYFYKSKLFIIRSFLSFILMIFSWSVVPTSYRYIFFYLNFILIIIFSSFNIYSLLGSGWRRNNKYSLLGAVRGRCQVVSYEVNLIFIIVFPSFFYFGYSLINFYINFYFFLLLSFIILVFWLILILLETNRSPFDFAEGESELVSGFKTEYSSLVFAYLFLGEYGNIALLRLITVFLFFGFLWTLLFLFFCFFFIWVRGTFPRFRYDMLMVFCWTYLLPTIIRVLYIILLFL